MYSETRCHWKKMMTVKNHLWNWNVTQISAQFAKRTCMGQSFFYRNYPIHQQSMPPNFT